MAMATVSTMGAVAPVFAAEITGEIVKDMDLDLLTNEVPEVRVKAEKDLEVTKKYLEEKHAEKDTNGNPVFKITESRDVHKINGVNKVVVTIEISRNDDATNKEVEIFTFTQTQLDQDFGQEVPVQIVELNIGDEANRARLSKMIYQLKKASDKITVVKSKEESQEAKLMLT